MVKRLFLTPPTMPTDTVTRCLVIPASKEWLGIFNAALLTAANQYNYEQVNDTDLTPEECAAKCYQVYETYLSEECEVCNCDCTPALFRYDANGNLEVSTDGGVTWSSGAAYDPRFTAPLFPQLPGDAGATMRCQAADNIVDNFTAQIVEYVENLNNDARAAELVVAIAGEVALFIGVFAPYTVGIIALAAALVSAGAAFVEDAFDPDVWDRLRCNIFCHTLADGTITADGYYAIGAQVATDETGLTAALLRQMLQTLGANGLTNAGRTGSGAGTDCGDCTCSCDEPTSSATYVANAANINYTVGNYVVDGTCDGRQFGSSGGTSYVRLVIPDRDGRLVRRVAVGYCDSSGSPLDVDVHVGATNSDEGTQEAHSGAPFNFATPVDDDQVDVIMPTPSQGWLLLHHITVYYCEGV